MFSAIPSTKNPLISYILSAGQQSSILAVDARNFIVLFNHNRNTVGKDTVLTNQDCLARICR